jgi:hypothetical protein
MLEKDLEQNPPYPLLTEVAAYLTEPWLMLKCRKVL